MGVRGRQPRNQDSGAPSSTQEKHREAWAGPSGPEATLDASRTLRKPPAPASTQTLPDSGEGGGGGTPASPRTTHRGPQLARGPASARAAAPRGPAPRLQVARAPPLAPVVPSGPSSPAAGGHTGDPIGASTPRPSLAAPQPHRTAAAPPGAPSPVALPAPAALQTEPQPDQRARGAPTPRPRPTRPPVNPPAGTPTPGPASRAEAPPGAAAPPGPASRTCRSLRPGPQRPAPPAGRSPHRPLSPPLPPQSRPVTLTRAAVAAAASSWPCERPRRQRRLRSGGPGPGRGRAGRSCGAQADAGAERVPSRSRNRPLLDLSGGPPSQSVRSSPPAPPISWPQRRRHANRPAGRARQCAAAAAVVLSGLGLCSSRWTLVRPSAARPPARPSASRPRHAHPFPRNSTSHVALHTSSQASSKFP